MEDDLREASLFTLLAWMDSKWCMRNTMMIMHLKRVSKDLMSNLGYYIQVSGTMTDYYCNKSEGYLKGFLLSRLIFELNFFRNTPLQTKSNERQRRRCKSKLELGIGKICRPDQPNSCFILAFYLQPKGLFFSAHLSCHDI